MSKLHINHKRISSLFRANGGDVSANVNVNENASANDGRDARENEAILILTLCFPSQGSMGFH